MDEYDGEERRTQMKSVMKEALKEWLDSKFGIKSFKFLGFSGCSARTIRRNHFSY